MRFSIPRLVQFIIRWLTHAELSTCIKSEVPTFISTGSKNIDGSQNSVAMILYDTALQCITPVSAAVTLQLQLTTVLISNETDLRHHST